MKTHSRLFGVFAVLFVLFACQFVVLGQKYVSDPQFKVKIDFNRWHDVYELHDDMRRLEKAYPKFLKTVVAGKSHNGLDVLGMIINNPDTGPEADKSAMYVEANIHGGEIPGGEICLYTIWYLMENYSRIEKIKRLVDERVFYIFPCVNPDGRQYFMEADGGGSRTGHVPVDNDNDGKYDEDGANDLNDNGVIEQIIKYVPGEGTHRKNLSDPRILEQVPFGKNGDYILLGSEGLDDDGDGRINEDGPGGYDPNRNWAGAWQPQYIQGGAMDYPFQLPETRAISDFLMSHPNIAGLQTHHTSGGLIMRGPGSEGLGEYSGTDLIAYDEIGKNAERILPFYRYIVLWSGMYDSYGSSIDWTFDGLGIISFGTELWNSSQYFTSPELHAQAQDPNSPISGQKGRYFFDDYLEFGDQFVDWKDFSHPDYGKVEMGGRWKKSLGGKPPRFMTEELCHRHMSFALFQADELPKMEMGEHKVKKIGSDVYRVWIDLSNPKIAPTIATKAAQNKVVRPDLLSLKGNVEIISASWINNAETFDYLNPITALIDQHDLSRIMIRNGHPGKTKRTIQYLVKGSGEITVTYDSVKGGKVSKTITL